ncbi:GerMN domain-containing protein [Natribacillus halophilus]|uniref:Germination protein M n=1 Tax=Natribacillus halophilus TaxID=549003 RepID=A0A1G8LTL2_9BACI|nr:GerMN domain-containing protein [Natribacillus halophilus]SDI59039.1 germination protein M [Natribacillus halophilus]
MRKIWKGSSVLVLTLLVAVGCSSGDDEPEQEEATSGGEETAETEEAPEDGDETEEGIGEEEGEGIERELYLLDDEGLVVPRTFQFSNESEVLKQSLEHLVVDGPITNQLPSGLQAVLPPDTEVQGIDITSDGTAVVDFSPEFEDYPAEQEDSILQAVTWTLTQFDEIEQVEIQINGHTQETLPQADTPVGDGTAEALGINLEGQGPADMTSSEGATIYFVSVKEDDEYYVPVTRRIDGEENEAVAVVEALLDGPNMDTNLVSALRQNVELLDEPELEDGVLTVNFNEALLAENDGTAVAEEALTMLTLSLTEIDGVEEVDYHVQGESELEQVDGESFSEPVSRPPMLNQGKF